MRQPQILARLCGNRFCLRIRRSETVHRTGRKLDKAPNGIWAPFPAIWCLMAWCLSISSTCVCTFVKQKVSSLDGTDLDMLDETTREFREILLGNPGIGFWGWQSGGQCYAFDVQGRSPTFDGAYRAAGAFTTITDLFGGLVMVCMMLGTCFPIVPSRYEILGYAAILLGVMDGSTLAVMGSTICKPTFFDYVLVPSEEELRPQLMPSTLISSSCVLGAGSDMAITAAVFWIIAAVGCLRTPLSNHKRKPNPAFRSLTTNSEAGGRHEQDDEAHRLYQKRREETEKRYREMFGDDDLDDSDEEGGKDGAEFKTVRPKKLSQVEEESEHEPNKSSTQMSHKLDDNNRDDKKKTNPFDDDDDYYEEDDDFSVGKDEEKGTERFNDEDDDVRSKSSRRSRNSRYEDDAQSRGSKRSFRSRDSSGYDHVELQSLTNSELV